MIIEVKKRQYLEIDNRIKEYQSLIKNQIASFREIKSFIGKINYQLKIMPNQTRIKLKDKKYLINKKLIQTDLYPMIHAIISIIISDKNNAFIHSSVVSKNKKGILIVGTFGQGKTTLALEMEKKGFEINSADHAHLYLTKNKLFMKLGSAYLKYQEKSKFLDKEKIISFIEIKEIIMICGMCDKGKCKKDVITDKNYIVKYLFPSLNWWTNSPIITDPNVILFNPKHKEMFSFLMKLAKIKKRVYMLRGDKRKISFEVSKLIRK